jgi:hypothetical protein
VARKIRPQFQSGPNNPSDQRIMPGNPADPIIIKQGLYIQFSIYGTKYGPFSLLDF